MKLDSVVLTLSLPVVYIGAASEASNTNRDEYSISSPRALILSLDIWLFYSRTLAVADLKENI